MSWIVNERENDWSLTWLNALIVTDWDDTDCNEVPEITPVDGLIDRSIGSDPEMIEKEIWSPLTVGEIENGLFFARTYEARGYENEEIGVRTVNLRLHDWTLTSLIALIVTDRDMVDWEKVPEMIPEDELSDNPIGRDPDVIENETSSPSTVGVVENGSYFDRT